MRPELLELLRNAFQKVVTDPDYDAAAKKSRRPISFASGQEVADNVEKIMQSPKEYVDLIKKAYGTAAPWRPTASISFCRCTSAVAHVRRGAPDTLEPKFRQNRFST